MVRTILIVHEQFCSFFTEQTIFKETLKNNHCFTERTIFFEQTFLYKNEWFYWVNEQSFSEKKMKKMENER